MRTTHLPATLLLLSVSIDLIAQIHDPGFEQQNGQFSTCYATSSIEETTETPILGGNHVLSIDAHNSFALCEGPDGPIAPFHYWELFGYPNGTTVTFSFWAKRQSGGLPLADPVVFHLIFGKMTSWSTFTFDQNVAGSNVFQQVTDEWTYYQHSCLVTGLGPGEPLAILLGANYSSTYNYLWVDNVGITTTGNGAGLIAGAWLDGALDDGATLMRDDLRTAGSIPQVEPYSAILGGPGGETVSPTTLMVTGNDAIVDWVRIEMRRDPTSTTPVAVQHALLQRDGDIVSTTGSTTLILSTGPGNYFVTIRHRNHLGVMSDHALALGASPAQFDSRNPATPCAVLPAPHTDQPRRILAGRSALWAGEVIPDGRVSYSGSDNDRDLVLQAIGGVIPTATLAGYLPGDVNLDGHVKYTGNNNDRDIILQTIGGAVPTAVRYEQVP